MAVTTTFPTITGSIERADDVFTFVTEAAILRGQLVAINATGVDFSVEVAVLASDIRCVGVAIEDADSGAKVAVKLFGPIVELGNGTDGEIDAGTEVMGGPVGTVDAATAGHHILGMTLEDMPASTHGKVMIYRDMFETA